VVELAEEALDEVALAVEIGSNRSLQLVVALGRDVGFTAALAD
jgi:hypothetical protein